jgi:hypothetical protein
MNKDILRRTRRVLCATTLLFGLFASHEAAAQTITVSNKTVWTTAWWPATTAVYVLTSAGDIITSDAVGNGTSDVGDWLSPKSGMSNFQVRATAGNCIGPALNVWQPLSGSPNWHITAHTVQPHNYAGCTATLEISAIANPGVILATWGISLNASY